MKRPRYFIYDTCNGNRVMFSTHLEAVLMVNKLNSECGCKTRYEVRKL